MLAVVTFLLVPSLVHAETSPRVILASSHGTVTAQPENTGTEDESSGDPIAKKSDCNPEPGTPLNKDNCQIVNWLLVFINVLSGLVGIVIVIMITISGIQYSAAGDNPQTAAAAKKHLMNAVVALILFIFGVAALQYLVPGGVL